MKSSRFVFFLTFTILAAFALEGCMAPPQNFPIGSEAWNRANPEFQYRDDPDVLRNRHEVLVGVLDGGLDYNHPRLKKNIHLFEMPRDSGRPYGIGFDVLGNDHLPSFQVLDPESLQDISGQIMVGSRDHGTHVAQLITLGNPKIGLVPVRVLPAVMTPEDKELYRENNSLFSSRKAREVVDSVTRGLEFCSQHHSSIVNMSLGISVSELRQPDRDTLMNQIRTQLVPRIQGEWSSILIVVAASNEGVEMVNDDQMIPATLEIPDLLSIGALADSRMIADYSNWGRFVDVYVRGSEIRSAVPGGWDRLSGTSMAAPLVTHLAAELKLIDSTLTPRQIRALILNTADARTLVVENSAVDGNPPVQRTIRVLNMLRARRKARELLSHRGERDRYLTPPYLHGNAPF